MRLGVQGVLLIVAIVSLLVSSMFFVVEETKMAVVLEFQKPVKIIKDPGLYWKKPFVQEVLYFERRLMAYNADPERYLTVEKKPLVVDSYAEWRISNPLKFYITVRNELNAQSRLADLIRSGLRAEFGKLELEEVVGGDRKRITQFLLGGVNKRAADFGIEVVDVRIKRVDLPQELSQKVYSRMKAERSREAKDYRSQGFERSEEIRSKAEREREELKATAYRQAQEIKGQGDAESAAIYASAYGKEPEFAAFYQTMQAYGKSLKSSDLWVVDTESEFFQPLQGSKH